MYNTSSHRFPLILAIVLHIFLFTFLFVHFVSPDTRNLQLQPDVNIIKAVAVNPAEVVAQITQIKAQQEQQHATEQKLQQEQTAAAQALQQQKEAAVAAKQAQQKAEKTAEKKAEAAVLLEQQQAEQKALQQKQIQDMAAQKKAEKSAETKKVADKKAIEAKKATEEKTKQEEVKQQQLVKKEAEKKKQQKAAQELKLAQQKEVESQMAAEKKELEAARTNQNQSEIEKYTALILHTMRQNWMMPDGINPEISCQLAIRLKADGTVVSVNVLRSSGNAALDNSARLAVFKSSPLPVPADKDLFESTFREFNLTVSKKD